MSLAVQRWAACLPWVDAFRGMKERAGPGVQAGGPWGTLHDESHLAGQLGDTHLLAQCSSLRFCVKNAVGNRRLAVSGSQVEPSFTYGCRWGVEGRAWNGILDQSFLFTLSAS